MIIGSWGIGKNGGLNGNMKTLNLKGLEIGGIECSINGLTDQTLMGWVMVYSGLWSWVDGPGWAETGGWGGTYFGRNEDTMEVRFGTGSSESKKQFQYVLPIGEWHHYCFTRSDGSYKFYCDGVLTGTQNGSTEQSNNNSNVFYLTRGILGKSSFSIDISIVGYAAFSRALSSTDVQQAFTNKVIDVKKEPYNSGMILGLNVLEGEGDKIYDVVSGEYASISGEPNWDVQFNP